MFIALELGVHGSGSGSVNSQLVASLLAASHLLGPTVQVYEELLNRDSEDHHAHRDDEDQDHDVLECQTRETA